MLEKALAKGSIQIAPAKNDPVFSTKPDKKGKGNKQKRGQDHNNDTIDFSIINKFNKLKLTVPMKHDDLTKTITELD